MDGAIADGQAAPKGKSLDLTNTTVTKTKRLFGARALSNKLGTNLVFPRDLACVLQQVSQGGYLGSVFPI